MHLPHSFLRAAILNLSPAVLSVFCALTGRFTNGPVWPDYLATQLPGMSVVNYAFPTTAVCRNLSSEADRITFPRSPAGMAEQIALLLNNPSAVPAGKSAMLFW